MRVVDDDADRRGHHALEAARDAGTLRDADAREVGVEAERDDGREGAEGVGDVVAPGDAHLRLQRRLWCHQFEGRAVTDALDRARADVGVDGVDPVGEDRRRSGGCEIAPRRIVGVEDRSRSDGAAGRFAEALEEAHLRRAVRLAGAVEVEMVGAEVGQHPDVEVDIREALQREAVRGRLDDGVVAARLGHLGEQALDGRRLLRAHPRRVG